MFSWCLCAAVLYLAQEQLSELRRRLVVTKEAHIAATKDLHVILERKDEMESALKETQDMIRTGKLPPPKEELLELPQSKAIDAWESRAAAKNSIL